MDNLGLIPRTPYVPLSIAKSEPWAQRQEDQSGKGCDPKRTKKSERKNVKEVNAFIHPEDINSVSAVNQSYGSC